jgi:hypothetical protein
VSRTIVFVVVLAIFALVLGAMLLIGVLRGDDTQVDKNGVNSAPSAVLGGHTACPASRPT